jgi:hypothetical protein
MLTMINSRGLTFIEGRLYVTRLLEFFKQENINSSSALEPAHLGKLFNFTYNLFNFIPSNEGQV